MKGLLEKSIEKQVLRWLGSKDIFAFKVKSTGTFDPVRKRFRTSSPFYRKGCPDVLVVYKGFFVGLEIKTKTGRVSPHQKIFHADVKKAGGFVFVVRDVTELEAIFNSIDGST